MARKKPEQVMARKKQDRLVSTIESALAPGYLIRYHASFEFISDLEEVEKQIASLVSTEPDRAVQLYETFIAGCHEKAEEIDDSDGELGTFVQGLFCGWIRARQAAGADADETVEILISWMDDDPYGFCYRIERDAVKVLDRAGRRAFERSMRDRLAAKKGRRDEGRGEYRRSRAAEALRTLYAERKNAARYEEICELTGLTTEDCKVLAEIHTKRRKSEEALAWVERGISMLDDQEWDTHGLYDLQRKLLFRLGRKDEALDSAWQRFESYPCDTWYDELMKYVPRGKRAEWHRRALDAAVQGELGNLIQLCLKTKEVELLVQKVHKASHEDLEEISHYTTEPAAKRLAKPHPDLAAKLYRAQGMRIVTAKKSKYYAAAHDNFEQAKKHYDRAGLQEEWEALVELIREEHSRKSSFMPGFERVVAGETAAGPSFAERTRRQWERRGRR